MISYDELKSVARAKGISAYNADKAYLQDILLLSLYGNTKRELVFKGGTALYKFYKLPRFSEDLDFTLTGELERATVENAVKKMELFGLKVKVSEAKDNKRYLLMKLRLEGPLYGANGKTSNLRLDLNRASEVTLAPTPAVYRSMYSDVPQFQVLVMAPEEILAEKIRAIIMRNAARDLYDASWLIEIGTKLEMGLVESKMAYYGKKFDMAEFRAAVLAKKERWDADLRSLSKGGMEFAFASDRVLTAFKMK